MIGNSGLINLPQGYRVGRFVRTWIQLKGERFICRAVADEADGSQTLTIGFSSGSSLQASDELILDSGYAYLVSVAEWVNGARYHTVKAWQVLI